MELHLFVCQKCSLFIIFCVPKSPPCTGGAKTSATLSGLYSWHPRTLKQLSDFLPSWLQPRTVVNNNYDHSPFSVYCMRIFCIVLIFDHVTWHIPERKTPASLIPFRRLSHEFSHTQTTSFIIEKVVWVWEETPRVIPSCYREICKLNTSPDSSCPLNNNINPSMQQRSTLYAFFRFYKQR